MPSAVQLTAPRTIDVVERAQEELTPKSIRIQALLTGISHGTELNLYRGTSPFHDRQFDLERRVFRSRVGKSANYPRPLGYEFIGRITETGSAVSTFHVGDLVHLGEPHQTEVVVDEETATSAGYPLVKLPSGMSPESAVFVSLGTVALLAVHDAAPLIGDKIAVFGMGTIGLIAIQLAQLAGAALVVAVDPIESRREMAQHLGADISIDPTTAEAGSAIKDGVGGMDVSIETSGRYDGLHEAIAACALGGRVVTVGYYQGGGSEIRLGEEWHHNRVELISSMGLWDAPHRSYPGWDRRRLTDHVVKLIGDETISVAPLLSKIVPFREAAEAYRVIDEQPDRYIKVALSYEDVS